MHRASRVAVVGAGWAGLAAAVRAVQAGYRVSVFEMAGQAGGRARCIERDGMRFDNGQHILIGAYLRTLDLMRSVGVDTGAALLRLPLTLRFADGRGLALPQGAALPALLRGLASARGLGLRDRGQLAVTAAAWAWRGFGCDPGWTVDRLCRRLSPVLRELLIDPLCVAALNTPADQASGEVFLRVLRDALFSSRGGSDLLLPRHGLDELLPAPAWRWLGDHGAERRVGRRVDSLAREANGWRLDGEPFDAVVLACGPAESARLAAMVGPELASWAATARALRYEPIVTVHLLAAGARLPLPMLALRDGPAAPAQFVFDHGQLGGREGHLACVVSGAGRWIERGLGATAAAAAEQLREQGAAWIGQREPTLLHVQAEKRATFRCVPGLQRPAAVLAEGLVAAGDHIAGPYPATLEGAVRSGEAAFASLQPATARRDAQASADARIDAPAH